LLELLVALIQFLDLPVQISSDLVQFRLLGQAPRQRQSEQPGGEQSVS
jgi:hypothetical protein